MDSPEYPQIPKVERLVNDANFLKEDIRDAKVLQEFSFDGNNKPIFKSGRAVFPSLDPRLGFSVDKMLIGIIAGDFEDNSGKVKIYYPHVRENQFAGITVFHMDLETAAEILGDCAENTNLNRADLKFVLNRYSSRAMYGVPEIDLVHEKDIAWALQSKFQNTP